MPFPNEHAARQRDPDLFAKDSFRRVSASGRVEGGLPSGPSGVSFIMARLRSSGKMAIQSVRFSREWGAAEAKAWLREHDFKADQFEEAKEMQKRLIVETLKANEDAKARGVMVSLPIPAEAAKQLAMEGGEEVQHLHLTLAYFGKTDELPEDAVQKIGEACATVAKGFAPLKGVVGGIGRFGASQTSDAKDVIYASYDSPTLNSLREKIVEACKANGVGPKMDHGFTPHITLAYVEQSAATPSLPPRLPLSFDAFELVVGNKVQQAYPLRAAVTKAGYNTAADAGSHLHHLDRSERKTHEDGRHRHSFLLPNGSILESEEDGAHVHPLISEQANDIQSSGPHTHKVVLPDGTTVETDEDGEHHHQNRAWTTAEDGVHTHTLRLPTGDSARSLSAGELYERLGGAHGAAGQPAQEPSHGETGTPGVAGEPPERPSEPPMPPSAVQPAFATIMVPMLVPVVPMAKSADGPGEVRQFAVQRTLCVAKRDKCSMPDLCGVCKSEPAAVDAWFVDQIDSAQSICLSCLEWPTQKGELVHLVKHALDAQLTVTKNSDQQVTLDVPILKVDEERRIVTGIVLEPDEVDAQNDTIKAEVIEQSAFNFLADYGRVGGTRMGFMHKQFGDVGFELIESWIARKAGNMEGTAYKAGSWLMSVRVVDNAKWAAVKAGKLTGFSIGGTALVHEKSPAG